jgi:hypothetical protein
VTKRKSLEEKTCLWCGSKFFTNKDMVVCCSVECKRLTRNKANADGRRINRIIECVICGNEFVRGKGRATTCSKECSKERRKENHRKACNAYRDRNPDVGKLYYLNNKEKMNDKGKKYYEENKTELYEKQKEYNERNLDKVKEYKAKWYLENKPNGSGGYSDLWLKAQETRKTAYLTGVDTKTVSHVKEYLKRAIGAEPPPDLVEEATALRLLNRALREVD